MKTAKKLLAFLLAAALMLAVLPAAFADEGGTTSGTYTLTIKSQNDGVFSNKRTFAIYQIFFGDVSSKNSNLVLANVVYGGGLKDSSEISVDNSVYTVTVGGTVQEGLLESWKKYNNADPIVDRITLADSSSYTLDASADGDTYFIDSDDDGYGYFEITLPAGYYMVVETTNADFGDRTASSSMINVVGDQTMKLKDSAVTFEKKVMDVNDTTGMSSDWQDSADYDVGDDVPFKLTATLPSNYDLYDTYELVFHDQMCEGLTFNKNSVDVYVVNVENQKEITTDLVLGSGYTLEENVDHGDDGKCTFEVKFSNLKDVDNVNSASKIVVRFNATLNDKAVIGSKGNENKAKISFSNNFNVKDSKGSTPWDTVIVFTYKVIVTKTDAEQKPLEGASFKLSKKIYNDDDSSEKWVDVATIKSGDATSAEEGGKKNIFTFNHLDDGDYKLEEVETPEGYNTIDPIYFTIAAEHGAEGNPPALTSLSGNKTTGTATTIEFTSDKTAGSLSTTIVNKAGNTLPSTGGMGTTIFYIFGTILVLGAGILLIAKKRVAR